FKDAEIAYGSNAVRLTLRHWLMAGVVLLLFYVGMPSLWRVLEPLEIGPDYRVPYALSDDYWLYERFAGAALADANAIPIVGDSVVWGQYVAPGQTLAQALNTECARQFVNLGLNGGHPVALEGLIRHFGNAVNHRKVVLHFNPLWMTSKRRDLQAARAGDFNHPQLVPQVYPRIPSYEASIAERLSSVMRCRIPFLAWTAHLRSVYFGNRGLPEWTLSHPYSNVLREVTLQVPAPETAPPSEPQAWTQKDIRPTAFDWVQPEESIQWAHFQQLVLLLRGRGNDLFVVMGPFNEHMVAEANREEYHELRAQALAWLEAGDIAHLAPALLPSDLYADASHPLAAGYAALARELAASAPFQAFVGK
ncbi:MAG: hypothetical protein HYZ00_03625, partial [Candidatus Hydrogenedentes bacterium]|nr:hypothetical protein [Candidatus Hydrogenedentota bacterium]